jgi:hypothetical protein
MNGIYSRIEARILVFDAALRGIKPPPSPSPERTLKRIKPDFESDKKS